MNHSPRIIRFHSGSALLLVRFRDGGAAGLLKIPLDEVVGTSQELTTLMDSDLVRSIEDSLEAAPSDSARIDILQNFLKSRLLNRPEDPLIGESIHRIRQSRGTIAIGQLVSNLATNRDTLEKRFRSLVGTTPKMFSRIVRIRGFVNGYSSRIDLAEAALRSGFYDQSHLVKEFHTFTGQSPTTFFRTPFHW